MTLLDAANRARLGRALTRNERSGWPYEKQLQELMVVDPFLRHASAALAGKSLRTLWFCMTATVSR